MRKLRRGISLFEITIVMLVLGILAAVAAPRFSDTFQSSKLVAAANQIAGHVDYARRIAINEGRTTSFHCDSSADRYYSSEVTFPHLPGQLLDVDIRAVHDPNFDLMGDFDGQTSLWFDFEGVPHVGAMPLQQGTITVSANGRTLHIQIAAGTGDTTVTEDAGQVDIDIYDDPYGEPGYGDPYQEYYY